MSEDPELPTGVELEAVIGAAKAGTLEAAEFAVSLQSATLMLAVISQPGEETVNPFVIDVDGVDYGVAFTSPAQFDQFSAQTPFVLMAGAALRESWPAGLGLAINPGADAGILLAPQHLATLVRGADPAADDDDVVPAGTAMRIGAPDPGLPEPALDLLRRIVRSDPDVAAAYQLAVVIGDRPAELAVGVESAPGRSAVAEHLAARVMDADAGFRGLPFFDLDGNLLAAAREHSTPLA